MFSNSHVKIDLLNRDKKLEILLHYKAKSIGFSLALSLFDPQFIDIFNI